MSSHKSTGSPQVARAPTRRRGVERTQAILDTGAQVFAEKGFDAATMTEIAARSKTAIGSLYRFFPTKEVLANVLLTRYGERIAAGLAAIAGSAATRSPEALAEALIDLMLQLQSDRQSVAVLVDARSDAQLQKSTLRQEHRAGIAAILAATGRIPARRLEVISILVLQQLKSVSVLADEQHAGRAGLLAELRALLAGYLRSNWSKSTPSEPRK